MEKFNPKKDWKEIKDYIKEVHPMITSEDLAYIKGHEDEMLEILSQRTGRTKEDLVHWINNL